MKEMNKGKKLNTQMELVYSFAECDEELAKRIHDLRKRTMVEIVCKMVKKDSQQRNDFAICPAAL